MLRPTLHLRDPRAATCLKAIHRALSRAPSGHEVFYADEVDIDLNPNIGFLGSTQGCQRAIPTPGQNRKRYLAGALHARTGRVAYVEGTRKNSDLFLCLLDHLRQTYRAARRIILIVDNYIIHKCRLAHVWLKHNPKFRLLFQPAYQPWVNDIEKLWKQLHDNVTRKHRYSTSDRLMDAVRAFMRAGKSIPGKLPECRKIWITYLVNLGFGWRRARPTLHLRDPRAATRLKAIHRALSRAPSGHEVFYADEVDIDLNPNIGFLGSTQGCQRAIPTPGQNRKRYLAGALHARTGRVAYVEGTRKKQRPIPLPARPPAANLPRRASNYLDRG